MNISEKEFGVVQTMVNTLSFNENERNVEKYYLLNWIKLKIIEKKIVSILRMYSNTVVRSSSDSVFCSDDLTVLYRCVKSVPFYQCYEDVLNKMLMSAQMIDS